MVRLGQNFLADPNLLDAIVRSAGVGADDVVLEVGGGEGALTERLGPAAGTGGAPQAGTARPAGRAAVARAPGRRELGWGEPGGRGPRSRPLSPRARGSGLAGDPSAARCSAAIICPRANSLTTFSNL